MNATILCVGKLKEKWQADGCAEYLKRLSRYGKYEIVAVDDVREPEHPSEALIRQGIDREGAALMKHIRPGDRVVALCIRADAPDSVGLSRPDGPMVGGRASGGVRHRRLQRPVRRGAPPRRRAAVLLQPHLSPRPDARDPAGAALSQPSASARGRNITSEKTRFAFL